MLNDHPVPQTLEGASCFEILLLAIVFFVVAGVIVVSTISLRPQGPTRGFDGDTFIEDSFKKDKDGKPLTKERVRPRRPVRRQLSLMERVNIFVNRTLGFHHVSDSVKDLLSLLFGAAGTFFTWRSYRLQRKRAEPVQDN